MDFQFYLILIAAALYLIAGIWTAKVAFTYQLRKHPVDNLSDLGIVIILVPLAIYFWWMLGLIAINEMFKDE